MTSGSAEPELPGSAHYQNLKGLWVWGVVDGKYSPRFDQNQRNIAQRDSTARRHPPTKKSARMILTISVLHIFCGGFFDI